VSVTSIMVGIHFFRDRSYLMLIPLVTRIHHVLLANLPPAIAQNSWCLRTVSNLAQF
jgi:hypothetical protein